MSHTSRWLGGYVLVGSILLVPLFVERGGVLFTGQYVESLPVPILLVSGALASGLGWRLRRAGMRGWPWLGLAVGCVWLALEEAAYGRDPVFGWALFPGGDGSDVHDWLVHSVGPKLPIDVNTGFGIAAVAATGVLGALVILGWTLHGLRHRDLGLTAVFLLVAVAWAVVAAAADLLDLALDQYFRNLTGIYKLATEEAAEVLSSTAILFAVLAGFAKRRLAPGRRRS